MATAITLVIIGAGKLGMALMGYSGFAEYGLNIVAAFDTNPALVGQKEQRQSHSGVGAAAPFCQEQNIKIGVITVPAERAQEVCDRLIEAGIAAIWNFAPTPFGRSGGHSGAE